MAASIAVGRPIPRRAHARRARPRPRARARSWRRAFTFFLLAPLLIRLLVATAAILAVWWMVNWAYQVWRKPTELFFPVSRVLSKAPAETWREYRGFFREHSTEVMAPDLLAALAQAEGAGNPVARTYWRWQLTLNPLAIYQPASSAVGMFQITDGTFQEARRLCIHDHRVIEDGAWYDVRSCWFNSLYVRVLPSHAVELTAAHLDRAVQRTLERRRTAGATLKQKQDLAALIHLCGAGAGEGYARRGFQLAPGQRCGDHDAAAYLARVNGMKQQFARLAAAEPPTSPQWSRR